MNQPETGCCERLEWDSDFFGIRIGRVRTNHLSPAILDATNRWCAANAVDCLYFLADPNDAQTIRLAAQFGFNLVDIRMTLARRILSEEQTATAPEG